MILNVLKSRVSTEFYKFIMVGSWSTVINYGMFYALLQLVGINYLISSAIGFICGVFAGYELNRRWTFRVGKEKSYTEYIKYFTIYMLSLLLSLIFLKCTVYIIGLDPKVANILAIGLTTCTNFIGIKIMVFK